MMRGYSLTLLILVVLSLPGCLSMGESKRDLSLQKTLRNYETVVRWGVRERIKDFSDQVSESSVAQANEGIRVTHYEVLQGPILVSEEQARQLVRIQYVFKENQVVKEVMDRRVWQYDEEENVWVLKSAQPVFK
jgi:hypothetical protein